MPILLIFSTYLQIANKPLLILVLKRAQAIKNTIKKLQQLNARRKLQSVLLIRNRPNTMSVLDLLLQSDILIYCKNDGWTGLFKLIAIDSKTYIIDMPYKQFRFRSTVVRPYYTDAA